MSPARSPDSYKGRSTQTSPAEMVFGDIPLLPGDFAFSGKTPFFPSFSQASPTSPQLHRVDTPTPLATLARSKYVFVRELRPPTTLTAATLSLQSDSNGQQNIQSTY